MRKNQKYVSLVSSPVNVNTPFSLMHAHVWVLLITGLKNWTEQLDWATRLTYFGFTHSEVTFVMSYQLYAFMGSSAHY